MLLVPTPSAASPDVSASALAFAVVPVLTGRKKIAVLLPSREVRLFLRTVRRLLSEILLYFSGCQRQAVKKQVPVVPAFSGWS